MLVLPSFIRWMGDEVAGVTVGQHRDGPVPASSYQVTAVASVTALHQPRQRPTDPLEDSQRRHWNHESDRLPGTGNTTLATPRRRWKRESGRHQDWRPLMLSVEPAEQHPVVRVRRPAVGVLENMVDFTPSGGNTAAGDDAPAVPQGDRPALMPVEHAFLDPDADDASVVAGGDPLDGTGAADV